MNPNIIQYFINQSILNNIHPYLKSTKITKNINEDQKFKCCKCGKEIYHPIAVISKIHCRCEYDKWDFQNQSLYIQKIYRDEYQKDLVAIKIGITKQDGNVRKNFTDSFSIYHHKLYYEIRMNYDLAAKIEKRIKNELEGSFIPKSEMQDGYTETFPPSCLSDFHRIIEEELLSTNDPYMRVM